MAHLNLAMIHPFKDGNGRMARVLQTLVLARERAGRPEFSSIEEYLGRNTDAYYAILQQVGQGRWNPHRDALPWVRFCLIAHYRQAATLLGGSTRPRPCGIGANSSSAATSCPIGPWSRRVMPLAVGRSAGLSTRSWSCSPLLATGSQMRRRPATLAALAKAGLLAPIGAKRGPTNPLTSCGRSGMAFAGADPSG